jgi:drug/metabolite transporter (DMT)-like permease
MPGAERRAVIAMVGATLLWGATFVVTRDALAAIAPLPLVLGRFSVALAVFLVAVALRPSRLNRAAWLGGLASGSLTAGSYLFQAIGLTDTSAGSSAFLTCAGTLCAGFFAWPLLRQRPSPTLFAGILLALAGSALLSLRGSLDLGMGERWTMLGALLYALQIVSVARFAPAADPVGLMAVQALVMVATLAPFAAKELGAFATLDATNWMRFAYLAIPASVIAPLLQVAAQRTLPPGRVGLLFALEPVFALLFALGIGGEHFAPRWWLGAALILVAVVLVEARAARAPEARRSASA